MSQPQSEASETNIESSSVLLDLLRDHNSDIGNWCEIVNENQEVPVATIESFKSPDTIDENGPFYIFASNLNLRIQQKSNSFEPQMQEQIYQYFGGKENLYSVYVYYPWTKGCCMLNARNFEACIRVLQKDGELFREKPVKLEYVLSNTNSMKYIRFDHRQLDAQMQMYKMAHPPPPPEVPKPKPNPFGDAKPVNTKEKLKKLEEKLLRDEDRSYHQANLTTLQDQGQQQPKVNVVQPQQPARILQHSDSHGSGGGRIFNNSNMSRNRTHIPYEGGEGKEEMRNRTSTGPISSQSNNDRQKNKQHSSSQQSNPRNQPDGGQHRHVFRGEGQMLSKGILQTSLKAALSNDKNQRNYNPKGGNRSQNWHESGEEKGKGGGTGTSSSGSNSKIRPRQQHYDRTNRHHQLQHSNHSNSNVSNNSSKRDDNTSIGDSGSDAHVGEQKKLEHQKPPKHGTQEKQPDNNDSLGKEKDIADEKFHEAQEKLPKQISDEKQDDKTTVENISSGENVQKEQSQLENTSSAPTASNNHERSGKNKKKKPNKRGNGKNQDQGIKQNNRFDLLSNMNMDKDG